MGHPGPQALEGHLDSKEIPHHRVPWEPQVKEDLRGFRAQWDTLDTTGLTAFRGTMDLPATMAPEVLQESRVHRAPWDTPDTTGLTAFRGTMDLPATMAPEVLQESRVHRAPWDTPDTTGLTAFRGTMDLPATMVPEVLQVSRVHRGPWDLAGTMDRWAHLGPPQVAFLRGPLVLRGRLGPQEQGTLHGACTRKREKYSKHREAWPTR